MLDIKLIRRRRRSHQKTSDTRRITIYRTVYKTDEERRKKFNQSRSTEKRKKRKSRQIGILKREKQDISALQSVGTIGEEIRVLEDKVKLWKSKSDI